MTRILDTITTGNTKNPNQIIVILHGLGSNGKDLQKTAKATAKEFPQALILLPSGPESVTLKEEEVSKIQQDHPDFNPDKARSWFDINPVKLPLRLIFNRLHIIDDLNTMIDQHMAKHNLNDKNLAFFGFSQGGTMALYAAMKRRRPCAAVVAHSSPFPGLTGAKSKPETLMIIGDEDIEKVNNARKEAAKSKSLKSCFERFALSFYDHGNSVRKLKNRGIETRSTIVKDMGHTITPESLNKSLAFIKKRLRSRL